MPKPHLTVACILHKNGKFLFVREKEADELVYNQPAGHVEVNETLIEAAEREVLEETGWEAEITGFLGIYHYTSNKTGICYVRHLFVASADNFRADIELDKDIIDTCWMSLEEAKAVKDQMRSPLVLQNLNDFKERNHYPLSLISPRYWRDFNHEC